MSKTNLKNAFFYISLFFAYLLPNEGALAIEFKGKFIQGHFIIGKTEPETKIWVDKQKLRVTQDGYFAFGIGRDRKYDIIISLEKKEGKQKIVKKIQKENIKFKELMVFLKKK